MQWEAYAAAWEAWIVMLNNAASHRCIDEKDERFLWGVVLNELKSLSGKNARCLSRRLQREADCWSDDKENDPAGVGRGEWELERLRERANFVRSAINAAVEVVDALPTGCAWGGLRDQAPELMRRFRACS
jgi:hypothetical protein